MNFAPTDAEKMNAAINAAIDAALEAENAAQVPRDYLGGSRLGVECLRALGYEWRDQQAKKPKGFKGKTIRRFRMGHIHEDETAAWLRKAGFDLRTVGEDGRQFGFGIAYEDGKPRIAGHIDGAVLAGPVALPYPLLWEHKVMKASKWTEFKTKGVRVSHPVYFGQVQTYMPYMQLENGCLFTALNTDTSELWMELVPYDQKVATEMVNRGAEVILARSPEELVRIGNNSTDFRCKFCDHREECWNVPEAPAVAAPTWLAGRAA
jgi:hypothetical protein